VNKRQKRGVIMYVMETTVKEIPAVITWLFLYYIAVLVEEGG